MEATRTRPPAAGRLLSGVVALLLTFGLGASAGATDLDQEEPAPAPDSSTAEDNEARPRETDPPPVTSETQEPETPGPVVSPPVTPEPQAPEAAPEPAPGGPPVTAAEPAPETSEPAPVEPAVAEESPPPTAAATASTIGEPTSPASAVPIAVPPPAKALPAPAPTALAASAGDPPPARSALRRFGVGLDAGISGIFPDLGVLALYRPATWARLGGGLGYNLVRPGVKAAVTLVNPFVVPVSLTGEVGHYFDGNANPALQRFSGMDEDLAVLERVGYQYANGLLGMEFGTQRMTFYVRGGFTYMRMNLKRFDEVVKDAVMDDRASSSDPKVSYRGPTVKLGLLVYF